jgi:hypothetical protein
MATQEFNDVIGPFIYKKYITGGGGGGGGGVGGGGYIRDKHKQP